MIFIPILASNCKNAVAITLGKSFRSSRITLDIDGVNLVRTCVLKGLLAFAAGAVGMSGSTARASQADGGLQVIVTGTVAAVCEVGAGASLKFSDAASVKEQQLDLPFSCNSPYSLSLVSERGYLSAENAQYYGKFASTIEYELGAEIPFDNGTLSIIENCSSLDMSIHGSCGISSTQGRTSIAQSARLIVRLVDKREPLLAGEYLDRVRVTFSADI